MEEQDENIHSGVFLVWPFAHLMSVTAGAMRNYYKNSIELPSIIIVVMDLRFTCIVIQLQIVHVTFKDLSFPSVGLHGLTSGQSKAA